MKFAHLFYPQPAYHNSSGFDSTRLGRLLYVICGAVMAAVGLELFLVPNQLVVGGITGVSVLFAHLTEMRLGLFLLLLNMPLLILLVRKQIGKDFSLVSIYGLLIFALSAVLLHPVPALIDNTMAAAVCGGGAIGLGIGLVIRHGGFLDMTDNITQFLKRLSPVSTRRTLLIFNLMVFTFAGFVFGREQAMYSVIAYLLAFTMINLSQNVSPYMKMIWVTSEHNEQISHALRTELGRNVTFLINSDSEDHEEGGQHHHSEQIMVCHIYRLEVAKVQELIHKLDPDSSISFVPVTHLKHGSGMD